MRRFLVVFVPVVAFALIASACTGKSSTPEAESGSEGAAGSGVVEVGTSHAKVRLLTDPNSGIAGVVQRSRAQGMVQGSGADTLRFMSVSRLEDVVHGDRTVASGTVGIFPRGFGIGRVSSIEEKPNGSREIELVPEIDYRAVEEVLVLLEPEGGGWLFPPGLREPRP
ncbi:MAG: rod shape-determining protein MreC [Acidobacteria bacterium]|nr:rod shape-determining protein MreC [Acidobacteriota bacterium]